MSMYDSLSAQQQLTPQQAMQQLRADPVAMLKRAGLNIPAGMKDPRQMVEHLIQSGQVPHNRYQQILQFMNRR